jgi:hypothetical protein
MSKKHNLFVSFSAADNASESNFGGWVDNFIRYLTVYIQRINNESPEITPLPGDSKRPAALDESDGLILIVSNNYIKENLNKLDQSLLAVPSRVYKIDLDSILRTAQPKEIRTLNSFNFFESTVGSDDITRLSAQTEGQTFWLKIIDLAFEINRTMYQKKNRSVDQDTKTIYLAETSYDQINNRDEIKRELIRHGHIVLPANPFSSDLKELESQIRECLEKADLSVHIVGASYGEIPDGSDKSIVEIQNQLSTEHYGKRKGSDLEYLHRLIWMPLNLKARSDQQKIYLDQLKDDIVSTAGAEIIQTPLEILKTVIHSRLQIFDAESRIRKMKESSRSDKKSVYVLFDKKDESEMSSMIQDIQSRNIEVILPKFESKQIEFLESHRNSLVKSDAVLLYANKNLNWVNSKLNDVIKAPGFGKQFPFDAKAILIKDSSIAKDKIADFGDLIMLNGDGKDKKTDLGPFLDKIASS